MKNCEAVFSANTAQISRIVRASEVVISETLEAPRASARAVLIGGAEVAVPLEGLIDFEQERSGLARKRKNCGLRLQSWKRNSPIRNLLNARPPRRWPSCARALPILRSAQSSWIRRSRIYNSRP